MTAPDSLPRIGMIATVRNRRGLVVSADPFDAKPEGRLHLVRVEYTDGEGGHDDTLLWERERHRALLEKAGLTGHPLNDEQPLSMSDASLGTMHRAKGLEFKVVVVMGCDADLIPLSRAQKDLVDEADREAFVERERQLLYVACTRARERLLVTHAGKPSRWL